MVLPLAPDGISFESFEKAIYRQYDCYSHWISVAISQSLMVSSIDPDAISFKSFEKATE